MTEKRAEYQIYSDKAKQAAEVIWYLGHDLKTISRIVEVPISTLRTWKTRYNWGKQEPVNRSKQLAVKLYPDAIACQYAYQAGYEQGQEDLT
ncbi:MAG: hypothetical protein GY710_02030 [Desulfobacteraceae bacterium]|nr:hypothetical protein [Desulfobacteraceae bacterium]